MVTRSTSILILKTLQVNKLNHSVLKGFYTFIIFSNTYIFKDQRDLND